MSKFITRKNVRSISKYLLFLFVPLEEEKAYYNYTASRRRSYRCRKESNETRTNKQDINNN